LSEEYPVPKSSMEIRTPIWAKLMQRRKSVFGIVLHQHGFGDPISNRCAGNPEAASEPG